MSLFIGVVMRMFGGLLLTVGPALVAVVLRAIGVSVVSFIGTKIAMDALHALIKTSLQGGPLVMVQMLGLLKFDIAIEILFAAYLGRLTLTSAGSVVKRFLPL